uniref:Uncharacterized protein n=1 Tax=Zea mays TaxID=4577 RepID=A0A804P7W0_MAIZE
MRLASLPLWDINITYANDQKSDDTKFLNCNQLTISLHHQVEETLFKQTKLFTSSSTTLSEANRCGIQDCTS